MLVYIDIETRSDLDVRDVGAYVYGAHPSTEVLCLAWAANDKPVKIAKTPNEIRAFVARVVEADATLVAHNVDFERNVLRLRSRWLDTAALAARMSLPRSLEELAKALFPDRPEYHKDMAGNRTMLKLCKRNRKGDWWTPETAPADFEKLYAYCAKDVEVMRACHTQLLELSPQEQAIWEMTQRMNENGVRIDVDSLPAAQAYLERHTSTLRSRFEALTGLNPRSPKKVAAHFGLPSADKMAVRGALRDPARAQHHEALRLLQQINASSVSKVEALANRVSTDGRLRGAFMYCGAERTGRWSSVGVQLQNLLRGLGKETDTAFRALRADALELLFDGGPQDAPMPPLSPLTVMGGMLRGFLIADEGEELLVGDFAQIEARDLASLAGQRDLLDVFEQKGDPYSRMASRIYGREITKADKAERFMGKQTVLGCGYGMGFKRFREMLDEIYDVQIDVAFAKKVIKTYREANPAIVALWKTLQAGFRAVIGGRMKRVKVGPVFMGTAQIEGHAWAWIEIRSGRRLWYFHPYVKGDDVRYFGREPGRGWGDVHTHGGKIAENIVQAECRDIMAEAMLRLDAAGFKIRGTIHDEVICSGTEKHLAGFEHGLKVRPAWAPELPVDVEVFSSRRYRK